MVVIMHGAVIIVYIMMEMNNMFNVTKDWHKTCMERIYRIERAISRYPYGGSPIEERLARLEEAVKLIQFDNDIEPEKPVTEEKPKEEVVGVFSCPKCGFCSSIFRRDGRIGMKDDKPSKFISIPRDVAEKYIRYVEAKDAPEAIECYRSRQDVIDVINQQLE